MFRSFLSWRYLKTRRTNLIGIIGIFVGVGALILILSIMTGFLEHTRSTVRGSLADLIVTPDERARSRFGLRRTIPSEPTRALELIRSNPMVSGAAAHYNWYGIIGLTGDKASYSQALLGNSQHGGLSAVQLVGIDYEDEISATALREALEREPRYGERVADIEDPFAPPPSYDPFDDPDRARPRASVIVGEQLFSQFGLQRGEFIRIMTAVPDSETEEFVTFSREFVVAGSFRTGENEMDLDRIYIQRDEIVDFLGPERSYNEILVKLHDYDKDGRDAKDAIFQGLTEAGLLAGLEGYEVRSWEDYRKALLGAIENERALMAIMLSLVLIVAGFTVFAILSMMVTEKRRDIGILTAIGATPRGVMYTFLMIAFWDALIGASLGCVAGVWGALQIDAIERWLSRVLGVQIFNRDVYLFDHIPSVVQPVWVATIVLGAFVSTILFAAIPAYKAGRLDPLVALRYE